MRKKLYNFFEMEGNKIPIFESFALTSIVMPYYDRTDRAYLLLSSLSTSSRNKLDMYYDEFAHVMKNNIMKVSVRNKKHSNILLPSDLFIFEVLIYFKKDITNFIEFILKLNCWEGHYFKNHYLHQRVTIFKNKIMISKLDLKEISPYVDKIQSIKAWSNLPFENQEKTSYSLLNTINFIFAFIFA